MFARALRAFSFLFAAAVIKKVLLFLMAVISFSAVRILIAVSFLGAGERDNADCIFFQFLKRADSLNASLFALGICPPTCHATAVFVTATRQNSDLVALVARQDVVVVVKRVV